MKKFEINLEKSVVSPVCIPGVAAKPVLLAVFLSPAKNADGVAAERFSGVVRVDAGLVGREVLVDDKRTFDGPVFVDLVHDCLFIRRNSKPEINSYSRA